MKPYLLALLLLATLPCATEAQTMKADPAFGVKYVEERVVQLPADQHRPYLTLYGQPDDPRYQALRSWFETNANLAMLKSQCHYVTIDTSNPIFVRYAATTSALPCVRLQDHAGNVVAEFSGDRIPMSSMALAKGLNSKAGCWPFRPSPKPEPAPTPVMPQPDPPPAPMLEPPPVFVAPVEPVPTPVWPSIGLIVLAASIGGFLGVRRGWLQSKPN